MRTYLVCFRSCATRNYTVTETYGMYNCEDKNKKKWLK